MSAQNYFKELTQKEKVSKLNQFYRDVRGPLKIWIKGAAQRENFKIAYMGANELKLELSPKESQYTKKEVLYSFALNGLTYFGQGKLESNDEQKLVLACSGKLFKAERRETFRLLTYPAMLIYLELYIGEDQDIESNVIQIKTGSSETGLFKSFLHLLGDQAERQLKAGFIPVRVLDLSIGGLSVLMGEYEISHFNEGDDIINSSLAIGPKSLSIPKMKVVHVVDAVGHTAEGKAYKVGLQFFDLPQDVELAISGQINELLRGQEDEFEDFVT